MLHVTKDKLPPLSQPVACYYSDLLSTRYVSWCKLMAIWEMADLYDRVVFLAWLIWLSLEKKMFIQAKVIYDRLSLTITIPIVHLSISQLGDQEAPLIFINAARGGRLSLQA